MTLASQPLLDIRHRPNGDVVIYPPGAVYHEDQWKELCEYCSAHTSAPEPAKYLPISLDFQPICIDKPCIGQIDICPVDDECDSVKQCVEHAQWLRANPDVAERNQKIIAQHDAAIRTEAAKSAREKLLNVIDHEIDQAPEDEHDEDYWRGIAEVHRIIESLRITIPHTEQEQPR
jgi:hypothetical protein